MDSLHRRHRHTIMHHYDRLPRRRWLLISSLVLSLLQGCAGQLCDNLSEDTLGDSIYQQVSPAGGVDAGNYSTVDAADDLSECILLCCQSSICDVVFYSKDSCYHIHCNPQKPEGCQPKKRKDRNKASYMVIVRDPLQGSWPSGGSSFADDDYYSSPDVPIDDPSVHGECDPDKDYCGQYSSCNFLLEAFGYYCQCEEGYLFDQDSGVCLLESTILDHYDSQLETRPRDTSCTFGLALQCERHESCKPRNSRSKSGHCTCLVGYERDPDTRWCILAGDTDHGNSHHIVMDDSQEDVSVETGKKSEQKKNGKHIAQDVLENTTVSLETDLTVTTLPTRGSSEAEDESTSESSTATRTPNTKTPSNQSAADLEENTETPSNQSAADLENMETPSNQSAADLENTETPSNQSAADLEGNTETRSNQSTASSAEDSTYSTIVMDISNGTGETVATDEMKVSHLSDLTTDIPEESTTSNRIVAFNDTIPTEPLPSNEDEANNDTMPGELLTSKGNEADNDTIPNEHLPSNEDEADNDTMPGEPLTSNGNEAYNDTTPGEPTISNRNEAYNDSIPDEPVTSTRDYGDPEKHNAASVTTDEPHNDAVTRPGAGDGTSTPDAVNATVMSATNATDDAETQHPSDTSLTDDRYANQTGNVHDESVNVTTAPDNAAVNSSSTLENASHENHTEEVSAHENSTEEVILHKHSNDENLTSEITDHTSSTGENTTPGKSSHHHGHHRKTTVAPSAATTPSSHSDSRGNSGSNDTTTSTVTSKPTTTTPPVEPLVVSAGEDKTIQLPLNSATLTAYVVPRDDEGAYRYEWSLITHPDGDQPGEMTDINTENLKLTNLIAGLYVFKVVVSADGKYGEAFVNLTVLLPERQNEPPVAVVKPLDQSVNQPNDVVLDGSDSTDDDGIVSYQWEMVSGPMDSHPLDSAELAKPNILLRGLTPGKYRFKLTVTDSDGVGNSTFANVTYIKETDYPPMANAGSNIIISLPQNSITLYGNASTDDKGIELYEWIKQSDDTLTADMTGTRSSVLHLENLEVGDYAFTLKVTDTAGQISTAEVHVFVKPELNQPPVARAGKDKTVLMPMTSTTLDGSNSTDDQGITSYTWTQTSGPNGATIENSDRAVATASHLSKGEYRFKLTVTDEEGYQAVDDIIITVRQNENHAPVANAGGDQVIRLPVSMVKLDGSQSSDDKAIVSYSWTRDDKSLAAGDILNHTDQQVVLQLANLVAGRYIFKLTVLDMEGLSNSDTASVIVKQDPNLNDIVGLEFASNLRSFTEADKRNLQKQLSLLLHSTQREGDTDVFIQKIQESNGNLAVIFYATNRVGDTSEVLKGLEVVSTLKKKIKLDADVLDFTVIELDTVVCQKNCSGHGRCDESTKMCICEAFWMQNMFKYYLGDGESNCDWSVLYVIIIAFVVVVATGGIIWGLICLCKSVLASRWHRFRPKKRHRYTLLEEMDKEDKTEMLPRGKMQNSSLMVSESDFSSDEETLFINHKKANGHVKNGLTSRNTKNKIKT